jgi:hypothetical protein
MGKATVLSLRLTEVDTAVRIRAATIREPPPKGVAK